jgi:hypothetical protein
LKNACGHDSFVRHNCFVFVCFDPTDVFAAPEAPLAHALAALVQSVGRAAPKEHKRTLACHRGHIDRFYLYSKFVNITLKKQNMRIDN